MTLLCIDATADANVFVSSGDGASQGNQNEYKYDKNQYNFLLSDPVSVDARLQSFEFSSYWRSIEFKF